MEVIKLDSVSCSLCGSTLVFKKKVDKETGLACYGCSKVVLKNKTVPLDAERLGGATDPSYEMGDKIEGTVGVHEHNGNFCNRIK